MERRQINLNIVDMTIIEEWVSPDIDQLKRRTISNYKFVIRIAHCSVNPKSEIDSNELRNAGNRNSNDVILVP